MSIRRRRLGALCLLLLLVPLRAARAQEHEHMNMDMDTNAGWQFMQHGIVFVEFNHQGGPRGGNEAIVPNWWMGRATRKTPRGQLTFTAMLSLDPATVGNAGYRELFQAGESLHGQPLVDRQHPHDFFMELSARWRMPIGAATGLTFYGGPAAEPALGPVAFMHRDSAADNPTAPLTHHLLDSTHISFGVVTAAIDHGPWTLEGSVFNGREPDEHRWDFDFGSFDSVSARLWFRPTAEWAFQISTGHLHHPEALDPAQIERTTASASWTRTTAAGFTAVTAGFGRNDSNRDAPRSGAFAEATGRRGDVTVYGRIEVLEPEFVGFQTIGAFTAGGVREVLQRSAIVGGIGADLTLYAMRDELQQSYGAQPVSFHVFFRLRPRGSVHH